MKTKNSKEQKQGTPLRPMQLASNGQNENPQTATTPTPDNSQTPATGTAATPTINHQPTEQPSTDSAKRTLPYVNFQQRDANRALATDEVLSMLRQWVPQAYDLAEVVGKWIWVTFPEQPAEQVRGQLSQFGFHWNNVRKCWQHPCGQFTTTGTSQDPRARYGSQMASAARTAADLRAA